MRSLWQAPLFVLCSALLGLMASLAHAGSGGVYQVAGRPSGLALTIDSRWIDGNGQRPLRITLTALPPMASTMDRTLQLTFFMRLQDRDVVRVSDVITLREGQVSTAKVICVPQWSNWSACKLEVREGGRVLEDMSGDVGGFITTTGDYNWTEIFPSVLVIDRDAPPWNVRDQMLSQLNNRYQLTDPLRWNEIVPIPSGQPQIYYTTPSGVVVQVADSSASNSDAAVTMPIIDARKRSDAEILLGLRSAARTELLAIEDVPDRWIELTSADIIFISLDDALHLQSTSPEKWNAVRTWTAAGQTLIVSGVGDNLTRLNELEQLLQVPSGTLDSSPLQKDTEPALDSGWRLPAADDYGVGFRDAHNLRNNSQTTTTIGTVPNVPPPMFQLRRYELGNVIAFAPDDVMSESAQLAWALCALSPHDWSWSMRHGLSLRRDNRDYWSWRIPGVGVPPVKTFIALITLFAVIIGPLNYYFLRSRKRLTLLMVSVPIAGVLTTLLLLAYAIIADGLGTRVRTRSLTLLDQSQGRAVTWSRQTYYCGLRPSRGLLWTDSVVAWPIDAMAPVPGQQRGAPPIVDWSNGQSMRGYFIRPREMQQYMVIDASASTARLNVDTEQRNATNELGGDVPMLLVNTGNGFMLGRDIPQGASGQLTDVSGVDLTKSVAEMFDAGQEDNSFGGTYYGSNRYRYRYGYYYAVDNNLPQASMKSSVLNRHLHGLSMGQLDVPPGYFLALVHNPIWLPIGVEDAERSLFRCRAWQVLTACAKLGDGWHVEWSGDDRLATPAPLLR